VHFSTGAAHSRSKKKFGKGSKKENRMPARESSCASGRDLKESGNDFHEATAFRTACESNLAMRRRKVNEENEGVGRKGEN
jgi:hypothetical protein